MADVIYVEQPHLYDINVQRDAGFVMTFRFDAPLTGSTIIFTVRDIATVAGEKLHEVTVTSFSTGVVDDEHPDQITDDEATVVINAGDLPAAGTYYYALQERISTEEQPVRMKGQFIVEPHAGVINA